MTLQSAADAKIASDAAGIQTRDIISSLVMTDVINAAITSESTRTDTDVRIYCATIDLNADINGKISPIEIIQSDDTKVLLTDILGALTDEGYETAYTEKPTTRSGGQDRIILTILWENQ